MRLFACTMIFTLALASLAAAQPSEPAIKPDPGEARALAAPYELTSADATRRCPMTLEARPRGPGFLLAFERDDCIPLFGFLSEVAAWLPGVAGAILFVNPEGRAVTEFTEGVGGVYEAIRENDAVYFLANLQFADRSEQIQVTDLFGDWTLSRPNGPAICHITLTDELVEEDRFAVRILPGCDSAIQRLGATSWYFERGDIVFRSHDGNALRFGLQEDGAWAKVPERPLPLLMMRP